jgi:deazaflavin-dependent oxidoreductase (nitroreductase family)
MTKETAMTEAKLAPNLPQWMKDHVARYQSSGGTDGHMYTINLPNLPPKAVPSLLLTTTGRKSGDKYLFPLFYGPTGKSYFVVASKGGAPEHPGWYRNILANPEVEIQVGTAKMRARARTATGEERARLWKQAVVFWPPYADYQVKAGAREIPVVVLDPVK